MATVTETIVTLIKKTEEWKKLLASVSTEQQTAIKETDTMAQALRDTLNGSITDATSLIVKLTEAAKDAEDTATQLARVNAQFKATSSGYQSAFDTQRASSGNPFMATDYISGASQLTTEQKSEFLRIVTDQDKSALDKMVNDYKKQINDIYTDEYQSIKTQRDQLDKQREAIGKKIEDELAAIKGKEDTTNYRSTIKLIEQQRQEMSRIGNQSAILTQRIGQYDQNALRLEGQVSVLNRAWSDKDMQRQLAATKEATGYTQEELLFLVNKALETGAGTQFDKVALTELINKLNAATPTKRYQLDLTVGDQKLSAFTELSPEKFLDALLKARGTAI